MAVGKINATAVATGVGDGSGDVTIANISTSDRFGFSNSRCSLGVGGSLSLSGGLNNGRDNRVA